MHGLFFFFIQKFAETRAVAAPPEVSLQLRARIAHGASYLPDGSCPDGEAVGLLEAVSSTLGESLDKTHEMFGEYVAGHLIRIAAARIDRSWRTLELVEHADDLIRSLVHEQKDYSDPPVHETVRISPTELHLVYSSARQMCGVAAGIIRGMAAHFGESVCVEESACMHRGSPFCSFVIRSLGSSSPSGLDLASVTNTSPGAVVHHDEDPGLAYDSELDEAPYPFRSPCASDEKSPPAWPRLMPRGSSIETSSHRTSSSKGLTKQSASSTSAWPGRLIVVPRW